MYTCIYIYIHTHIHTYTYIYIYIYIERERERERPHYERSVAPGAPDRPAGRAPRGRLDALLVRLYGFIGVCWLSFVLLVSICYLLFVLLVIMCWSLFVLLVIICYSLPQIRRQRELPRASKDF